MCKSSLEVEQMTALYICVACEPLRLLWIFGCLWMGNAAKGGMEIYTPVHMDGMCYVSECNLHGGYNMMLSMVYLGRTLKLMQNGLRTTGIGYNTVKMRFMCM